MTKGKKVLVLGPLALIFLVGAWQGIRFWWLHNYSQGSRTGVIRKISVKGPPVCKFLSGEMVLIGTPAGGSPTVFNFTVYDDSPDNVIVKKLHDAEREAKEVTIDYQENRARWWQCADTNYYIVGVEK